MCSSDLTVEDGLIIRGRGGRSRCLGHGVGHVYEVILGDREVGLGLGVDEMLCFALLCLGDLTGLCVYRYYSIWIIDANTERIASCQRARERPTRHDA